MKSFESLRYSVSERKPSILPVTALGLNFNPQKTLCIPPVKIYARHVIDKISKFSFKHYCLFLTIMMVLMTGIVQPANGADVYIPHITSGFSDWSDLLQVDNNALADAQVTITLYGGGTQVYSQSHKVPGMGEVVLDLKLLSSTAECGVISTNDEHLFFRVTYENMGGGVAQFKLSDVLDDSLGFYFSTSGSSLIWKGLALANFSVSTAEITFYAVGSGAVLSTTSISIPGYSRIFGLHSDWFPLLDSNDVSRIIAVSASKSLTGIVKNGNTDNSLLVFSSTDTVSGFEPEEADPNADYVVFTWNDLGMHCLNPTYDTAVILPPYNTVWAQAVKKAASPVIVTSGVQVAYSIVDNTYSYGKREYGQFWDYVSDLFGVSLAIDTGLNLVEPDRHNGLSGTMVLNTDHYQVDGIPVTPVNDSLAWNPYQVAEIILKTPSGIELAKTRTTVPTSDEINCQECHGSTPFTDILQKHDLAKGTTLGAQTPVLCASCHGSPALGSTTSGSSGKFLSQAIHGSHASRGAECYDCHPGPTEPCNRSIAHTTSDGNCTTCHGTMAEVASSITNGTRMPWLNEPKCATCHTGVPEVDTGDVLYRNATGHGGLYCSTCHGSPHAMIPSSEGSDNYQAIQYQDSNVTIGSCGACHESSKGGEDDEGDDDKYREGEDEFAEKHGGASPETLTACHICHTSVSSDTTKWPHQFMWNSR